MCSVEVSNILKLQLAILDGDGDDGYNYAFIYILIGNKQLTSLFRIGHLQ